MGDGAKKKKKTSRGGKTCIRWEKLILTQNSNVVCSVVVVVVSIYLSNRSFVVFHLRYSYRFVWLVESLLTEKLFFFSLVPTYLHVLCVFINVL